MKSPWKQLADRVRSLRPLPMGTVADVSPVFIVGMPRSGTTLLRLAMNAHKDLAIVGGTDAFKRAHRYGRLSDPVHLGRLTDHLRTAFTQQSAHPDLLDQSGLREELASTKSYAEAVNLVMAAYAARECKTRWGEKTPGHVRNVDLIFTGFPRARVIHIVRDPRAVIVSFLEAFDTARSTDSHVYRLARAWRRNITLLDHYLDDPARYTIVRYEDLVRDPEATLREMCHFVGIDFVPEMLEFHRDAARHTERDEDGTVSDHHALTLESFRPDRAGRWRDVLSPMHAALVEDAAGAVMDRFGYRPSAGPGLGPSRVRHFLVVAAANATAARRRLQAIAERVGWWLRRVGRSLRSRGPA